MKQLYIAIFLEAEYSGMVARMRARPHLTRPDWLTFLLGINP